MSEPVDVSKKHFYVSLVKSAWRIIAAVLLALAGYRLWTDTATVAQSGYLIMLAGAGLTIAEILGIVEEL